MNINITGETILKGVIAAFVGGVLVKTVTDTYKTKSKNKAFEKKFDGAVKKIEDATEVEIEDAIIKTAVEKKVNKVVGKTIEKAANEAVNGLKLELDSQIREKVKAEFDLNSGLVKAKMQEEVDKIDVEQLRKEVISGAKRAISDKLKGDTDKILRDYGDKLDDFMQLYGKIMGRPRQNRANFWEF